MRTHPHTRTHAHLPQHSVTDLPAGVSLRALWKLQVSKFNSTGQQTGRINFSNHANAPRSTEYFHPVTPSWSREGRSPDGANLCLSSRQINLLEGQRSDSSAVPLHRCQSPSQAEWQHGNLRVPGERVCVSSSALWLLEDDLLHLKTTQRLAALVTRCVILRVEI